MITTMICLINASCAYKDNGQEINSVFLHNGSKLAATNTTSWRQPLDMRGKAQCATGKRLPRGQAQGGEATLPGAVWRYELSGPAEAQPGRRRSARKEAVRTK
ncbi:uncharacterized protein ZBIST_5023 [Zygosaccharomyces bailii]|nr:uncharacterized protein ZBIST_5023 [Zygosaccharomyces bailii]